MKRITERELMVDPEQILAYGTADFEEPHSNFIKLLKAYFPAPGTINTALDMGCGTGDITFKLGRAFPRAKIDAIDGSSAMLDFASKMLEGEPEIKGRISCIHVSVQEFLPDKYYDLIISNSLLHHMLDPSDFWYAVKRFSSPGTIVFVMDLIRPETSNEAMKLVERYSPNESEVLKRDFYNSLLAAFEIDEVKLQLEAADLGYFKTERATDRHVIVYGIRE